MYAGWHLVIIGAVLCGQSVGYFWPFTAFAATSASGSSLSNNNNKSVAIIGAGAGGSSAAYYLQQFASQARVPVDITVFERSSYVGGRSTTVNAYGDPLEPVELGASIFVDVNTILKNTTEKLGLKIRHSDTGDGGLLGIWNGVEFVYTQKDSGWQWWDIAKLLWKYGLAPIRTQRLMKSTVGRFMKLYEPPFFPFRSLSERAMDLDLTSVTSVTGEQLLKENSIAPAFSTDIIQASTRVNYGQNLNLIHGLETMVCMAIEGAMQIVGGNWQIFNGMLNASNATVLLNSTVTEITKRENKYRVKTTIKDSSPGKLSTNEELFDTVVLAAPMQYSGIDIKDDLLHHKPDDIPYVTLHVTLFTSPHTLSPEFFNLAPDAEVPTSILTTLPAGEIPHNPDEGVGKPGFFSISTLRPILNPNTMQKEYLYKIFSPKAVTSEFLAGILGVPTPEDLSTISPDSGDAISWYYPHVWQSYPYEYPRITFEDSELAKGFYYTSGMESFISTMETNALMGMNVAQLVVNDFLQDQDKIDKLGEKPLQAVLSEGRGPPEEL
ncbi:Uncharacterized protein BP5553_09330 [Venustampulla echinocandica]|uniref:Prenylcysteine lyase domain-containing protein n=1 Tax=Venustampulla echinocandica TaxID=2656787 RepID=A0A370TCF5_9HELO|nr:Uncharacterized protein BP5553_09330 [Venustampulla echinocandica]RDL31928.1 Uncharacterized protein BP5553_09330 [Venustampulla echinocandica]